MHNAHPLLSQAQFGKKKSAHYIRRFTVTKISSNSLDHLVALNPTIITKFEISWEPLPPPDRRH